MELAVKLLTVLGLGAIELWVSIPAGFALGLHPALTGITAAVGAILGALAVILLGERVRARLMKKREINDEAKYHGRIYQIWQDYGVAGLGIMAPLFTGAPLGIAMGLALGAPSGRLLLWTSIGIALWSAVLTLIGALGLAGIGRVL